MYEISLETYASREGDAEAILLEEKFTIVVESLVEEKALENEIATNLLS